MINKIKYLQIFAVFKKDPRKPNITYCNYCFLETSRLHQTILFLALLYRHALKYSAEKTPQICFYKAPNY